jgi:hypothetical protein
MKWTPDEMDICINQIVNAGVFHVSHVTLTATALPNTDHPRPLTVQQADRSDSTSAETRCRIPSIEGYRLRCSSRNVHRREAVENHRYGLALRVLARGSCLCKSSSFKKPLITLICHLPPAGL